MKIENIMTNHLMYEISQHLIIGRFVSFEADKQIYEDAGE